MSTAVVEASVVLSSVVEVGGSCVWVVAAGSVLAPLTSTDVVEAGSVLAPLTSTDVFEGVSSTVVFGSVAVVICGWVVAICAVVVVVVVCGLYVDATCVHMQREVNTCSYTETENKIYRLSRKTDSTKTGHTMSMEVQLLLLLQLSQQKVTSEQ